LVLFRVFGVFRGPLPKNLRRKQRLLLIVLRISRISSKATFGGEFLRMAQMTQIPIAGFSILSVKSCDPWSSPSQLPLAGASPRWAKVVFYRVPEVTFPLAASVAET